MNNLLNLSPGTSLHITKGDSFLFQKKVIGNKNSLPYSGGKMQKVNKEAAEILALCNGSRNIYSIINELSMKYKNDSLEEVESKTRDFITMAIEQGYIQEVGSDISKITGGFESYTPMHVVLELTDGCNLACPHCYRDAKTKDYILGDEDKILRLLEQLRYCGVRIIEITGGEPTLHPGFLNIVNTATDLFDMVAVITNGLLLTEEIISNIHEKDKIFVQIDIDGPRQEIHNLVHRSMSNMPVFDKAVNAVKCCRKNNILTRVAINVIPSTLQYLEETVDLALELDANFIGITPAMALGRAIDNSDLYFTNEQLEVFTSKLQKLWKRLPNKLNLIEEPLAKGLNDNCNCGSGWRTVTISPNGDVRPCASLYSGAKIPALGNVYTEELRKVFSNPISNLLADLPAPTLETCQGCPIIKSCVNCIAQGIKNYTTVDKCQWYEKNKEKLDCIAELLLKERA